jgi:hypothetical protein
MIELDHLKKIVFELDYDPESRKEVLELETQLANAAQAERIASFPTIADFIQYMMFQKEAAEHLLKTDREMTDRERDKMFERIDLTTRFISLFNGEDRRAVEETIKNYAERVN